jgi:spermidine/putrescine transport system substrate-binding protein
MAKSKFSTNELTDGMMSGQLSRRRFQQILGAAGVSLVMTPVMSRMASAAAADQATYFTWGGYDVPEMFGAYIAKHGETPNFASFGGSEEALTKMRAGYVVDVSHPCNQGIPRWVATGLFQTTDTSKLSNWPDVIPELADLEGNMSGGMPTWFHSTGVRPR